MTRHPSASTSRSCCAACWPRSARARAQAFVGMMITLALLRPAFDDLLDPNDEASVREYVQIMLRGVLAEIGAGAGPGVRGDDDHAGPATTGLRRPVGPE